MERLLSLTENLDNPELQENSENRHQTIKHIQETVQATNAWVEDIVAANNLQLGRWQLSPQVVFLESFCQQVVNLVQNKYNTSHHITLVVEGTPRTVRLDPNLLRYILYHLLGNAIQYSPVAEHPILLQATYQDDQTVMLQVQDRGLGIKPSDRDRIFDSFYRGSNVENTTGTGLGLTIVQEAVRLQGGRISVASNAESGTIFTVVLPTSLE
jgi:signal transduction histidine kinase